MTREEAIEIIKRNCTSDSDLRKACKLFIPELTENEDERIRKEIIGYLTHRANVTGFISEDRDCKRWISYLEKQKELPTNEEMLRTLRVEYEKGVADTIAKYEQREQKPAECIPDSVKFEEGFKTGRELGFREGVESVKPTEWSEDNIKELTKFEAAMLHIGMSFFGGSAGLSPNNTNEVKKQAKILLELVPKQEWSEEDESRLDDIEKAISITYDLNHAPQYHYWLEEKLQSLRSQPKQEWSEEDSLLEKCLQEIENATWEIRNRLKSLRPQIIDSTLLYTIEQVDNNIREAQERSEEQKEQKPVGTDFRSAVKNLMNLHKIKNEFTEEDYDFQTNELLKLFVQKPTLEQTLEFEKAKAKYEGIVEGKQTVIDNSEEYGLYKPTEWSEYDKGVLGDAIAAVDLLGNDESFNKSNPNLANAFRIAKDWLEHLPERFNFQPQKGWSDEEKDKLNSIERLIVNANAHGNSLIGDKEAIELQRFICSLVKPVTNIAEWTEEDNEVLQQVIADIEDLIAAETSPGFLAKYNKHLSWLKSLPERFNVKEKKQEWTKEDEDMLLKLLMMIDTANDYEEIRLWLCTKLNVVTSTELDRKLESDMTQLERYISEARTKKGFYWNNKEVSWEEIPLEERKHDYPYYFKNGFDCYPFRCLDDEGICIKID